MNDTINLKTARIFKEIQQKNLKLERSEGFDHSEVHKVLSQNSNEIVGHWLKFQQAWTDNAYKTFKDFDTYLILIYLARKVFSNYADKFTYFSMEEFYSLKEVMIEKINLIEISKDLGVPKETIRRKINFLKENSAIYRKGKKIYVNLDKVQYQKPITSIKNISIFLSKISTILSKQDWFGKKIEDEVIEEFIKKYFTICWFHFFRLQIPYIARHRKTFGDIESWRVWGSIGITNYLSLQKEINNKIISNADDHEDLFFKLIKHVPETGINASSISDISGIPRATVTRKLKHLVKKNYVSKNSKLQYSLNPKILKLDKNISRDYHETQKSVSVFATKIFDLMKNSNLQM